MNIRRFFYKMIQGLIILSIICFFSLNKYFRFDASSYFSIKKERKEKHLACSFELGLQKCLHSQRNIWKKNWLIFDPILMGKISHFR